MLDSYVNAWNTNVLDDVSYLGKDLGITGGRPVDYSSPERCPWITRSLSPPGPQVAHSAVAPPDHPPKLSTAANFRHLPQSLPHIHSAY